MLTWTPKRGKEGGWNFYSATIPVALILMIAVLVILWLLRLIRL